MVKKLKYLLDIFQHIIPYQFTQLLLDVNHLDWTLYSGIIQVISCWTNTLMCLFNIWNISYIVSSYIIRILKEKNSCINEYTNEIIFIFFFLFHFFFFFFFFKSLHKIWKTFWFLKNIFLKFKKCYLLLCKFC